MRGLSCRVSLPLAWSPLTAESGVGEQSNPGRLQIILGLDDSSRDLQDGESDLAVEIQRLDFKINMILEMVSHLVTMGRPLPPAHEITLSSGHLIFETAHEPPRQGMALAVELFPEPRFPFPLVLTGRAVTIDSDSRGGSRITVLFDPFPEPFQGLFEKYIFRCHRRHVARMKKGGL